jgi:hypothetical protein
MRQSFTSLVCLAVIGAAPFAVSCGGNVVFEDEGDDAAAGSPSGGSTGTGTGPGTGSGTGSGTAPDEAAAVVAAECPNIAAEPHYCLTFGYPDTVWAVGPDTGNLCQIGTITKEVAYDVSSVAIAGTNVHGCGYDIGVWRASITGGPADVLQVECTALTGYQGGFLRASIDGSGLVDHYATFEDIADGKVTEVYKVDPQFSRMSTRGNTLFTAWHSTNLIQVYELPGSTPQPSLILDGFDDWVNGMSATADGRLYILSSGNRIVAFDVASGKLIQEVNTDGIPGGLLAALHCWSN